MISGDFFSVANNLGDSGAFNLESDTSSFQPLLPGIKLNTSPTNHRPIRQVQLAKLDGTAWLHFGNVIISAGNWADRRRSDRQRSLY